MEEILCVVRLGLPKDLRRSLACTNIIENMNGMIRQVTRNVKRWRDASMALRWTAAGMMEARKGFRRLKAYKQLPKLRDALLALRAARAESRSCQFRRGRVSDCEQRLLICNTGRDISAGSIATQFQSNLELLTFQGFRSD